MEMDSTDETSAEWERARDLLLSEMHAGDAAVVAEPAQPYGERRNGILSKSKSFALRIITFTKVLRDAGWKGLSEQLFDAGTSIGANMNEAQQAESRRDFIHKTRISAKEAKESKYWLDLCRSAPELPYEDGLWELADELNAILGAILKKAIENDPARKKR